VLGRPELICANVDEYVARAIALDAPRVARAPALFDIERFARDFEALLLAL
jgi:predicted O-linked N-acetylglucosamine transferase (SPINDLY family)